MPRIIIYALLILTLLAILPPVIAANARSKPNPNRPINIIQDMDLQAKFLPQSENDLFADKRSQRPQIVGTVARGETYLDTHFVDGVVDGQWATTTPSQLPMNMELLLRGQDVSIYIALHVTDIQVAVMARSTSVRWNLSPMQKVQ